MCSRSYQSTSESSKAELYEKSLSSELSESLSSFIATTSACGFSVVAANCQESIEFSSCLTFSPNVLQ